MIGLWSARYAIYQWRFLGASQIVQTSYEVQGIPDANATHSGYPNKLKQGFSTTNETSSSASLKAWLGWFGQTLGRILSAWQLRIRDAKKFADAALLMRPCGWLRRTKCNLNQQHEQDERRELYQFRRFQKFCPLFFILFCFVLFLSLNRLLAV